MTTNTPAPGPDASDGTAKPSHTIAATLLQGATNPATTAGTAAADPKLPPFRGD
jgi:hypothetical protein